MPSKYWELPNGRSIITPTRLADELGVSRPIVYHWIRKGLPVIKSGDGKMVVLYNEALLWLREQKRLGNIKSDIPKAKESDEALNIVKTILATGVTAYTVYKILDNIFGGQK